MKSKSRKLVKSFKSALIAAASSMVMTGAFAASIDGTTSVRVGGKVQSVDVAAHQVTVVNAKGATEAFQVGSNVANLDQLKAGTNVVGMTQRAVRLTVLDSSSLAAVPSPDGDQTVASVTRVDRERGRKEHGGRTEHGQCEIARVAGADEHAVEHEDDTVQRLHRRDTLPPGQTSKNDATDSALAVLSVLALCRHWTVGAMALSSTRSLNVSTWGRTLKANRLPRW